MKRPVLLFVDDDPAVLESLEAALRPAFEEICRIEAFESPTAALSVLAIWESEDRPVAVAIVDQKMPGMTGVQTIERLRRFAAGRLTSTVLLTGYSDLEAVLAAINEGRVDRYVEKPWRPGDLAETVRYLLARHLAAIGRDTHRVFREAATPEEREAVFRLRHEVYRRSPLAGLLPRAGGAWTDRHDATALQFAVFERDGLGERMVGTLRVATGADALPCLDAAPQAATLRAYCAAIRTRGERVAEPGRLAVLPECRSPGMAYWVFDSAVGVFLQRGIDHAVLTCSPPHERFYERLGFRTVPGTALERGEDGIAYHPLTCSVGTLPDRVRERVEPLARRYAVRGLTCSCPTYPECFGNPYTTGSFAGTDLFCPMRTAEILEAA
jgi:CheY-like chemotaxis protein